MPSQDDGVDRSVKPSPELEAAIREYIKNYFKELTPFQVEAPFRGKGTFVFVPTGGKEKKIAAREARAATVFGVELPTGINEPFGRLGQESAAKRLENALPVMRELIPSLDHARYGRILICVAENFVERGEVTINGLTYPAVDYGICAQFDVLSGDLFVTVSNGAPVLQEVLNYIEKFGYFDDEKLNAKKTPGDGFSELHGLDPKDWHKFMCGKDRVLLLIDAFAQMPTQEAIHSGWLWSAWTRLVERWQFW